MKRRLLIIPLALAAVLAGGATRIVQDTCGPFTDVSPPYCPFVLEMYYLGIAAGTSATTFSPDLPITRGQAAVFVSSAVDQTIRRSSPRAAAQRWFVPREIDGTGLTSMAQPITVQSDGADLWVGNGDLVFRVRGSDGRLLETWTAAGAMTPIVAMGSILIVGSTTPGRLYRIDPSQPAGQAETVATVGDTPIAGAFDGGRIWTADTGGSFQGSISIVTPGPTNPWSVTTLTDGFVTPYGVLFDGTNIWVTDAGAGTLLRLDSAGTVIQTVPVGGTPLIPAFDGANIWVPNQSSFVSVVEARTGKIVSTLAGNGLTASSSAAFDGERILVTHLDGVSLWKAADLTPLGSFLNGVEAGTVCSDGLNFWITVPALWKLVRF